MTAYTKTGRNRSRGRGRSDWKDSHLATVRRTLARATADRQDLELTRVDAATVRAMAAMGGTPHTVRENATALRGMLEWGMACGVLTAAQSQLMPTSTILPTPALLVSEASLAPARHTGCRPTGTAAVFVTAEDTPTWDAVAALGAEMERVRPRWGRLAVELAAISGPRWGELFQLTADDLDEVDGALQIAVTWQIDSAAPADADRRTLPKSYKTRVVPVVEVSPTGYRVADALRDRAQQARTERDAGVNSSALIFPTPTGLLHFQSGFHRDVWTKAAIAAGWPYKTWTETKKARPGVHAPTTTRNRIQFDHTWHSLRHRFARFAIDQLGYTEAELTIVGGWENTAVVRARYYRPGEEHQRSASSKAAQWTPDLHEQPAPTQATMTAPIDVITHRLAAGEITPAEYREIRELLNAA